MKSDKISNRDGAVGVVTKADPSVKTATKHSEVLQKTGIFNEPASLKDLKDKIIPDVQDPNRSTIGKALKFIGNIVDVIKPALMKEAAKIKASTIGHIVNTKETLSPGGSLFNKINDKTSKTMGMFDKSQVDKLGISTKGAFVTKEVIENRKKHLDPATLQEAEEIMAWDKTKYVGICPTEVNADTDMKLKRLCQMCQCVVNVDMVLCPSCAKLRRGLYEEMEPYYTKLALIKKKRLNKNKFKQLKIQDGIRVHDNVELGTHASTTAVTDDRKGRVVNLGNGVLCCHKVFDIPENCRLENSPAWMKGYLSNKINSLDQSLNLSTISPTYELLSQESVKFPVDMTSIKTRLEESFSRDNMISENRTHWSNEGIRRRERLYSQGLHETVTSWQKEGIKQRQVKDQAGTFDFTQLIKGNSVESSVFNYGDVYIEESMNYDTETCLWKYRGKNRFLVHCSLKGEDGNRVRYTRIDEGNNSRMAIDYGDGRKYIDFQDGSGKKKGRIMAFPARAFQIDYSTPDIRRKSVIHGTGRGMDIKINSRGEKEKISWLPMNQIVHYTKKYQNGTVNTSYHYDNNITRQLVFYPDGNSYDLLALPNGVTKKIYSYKDGTKEGVTCFEDGKTRRTVRYTDKSLLSEVSYGGDKFKLGMKYADGTSYLCKSWENGTTQQCFSWPDSGVARLTTGFNNDSIVERRTIYADGSYMVEVNSEDGESYVLNVPKDILGEKIYKSPLFELLSSPVTVMKLLDDPFHNPLLTLDSQLWSQILLIHGKNKEKHLKSIQKIQDISSKYQKDEKVPPLYLKVNLKISSGKGV
ncbi:MAG: hypothetical protein BWY64_01885 [bacterium ADurb.Bin363]|nr:MAG: hypothetical protein BWY64_01885 [bacterium ADurb.Bin363]